MRASPLGTGLDPCMKRIGFTSKLPLKRGIVDAMWLPSPPRTIILNYTCLINDKLAFPALFYLSPREIRDDDRSVCFCSLPVGLRAWAAGFSGGRQKRR